MMQSVFCIVAHKKQTQVYVRAADPCRQVAQQPEGENKSCVIL